jgi:hypothetical protein
MMKKLLGATVLAALMVGAAVPAHARKQCIWNKGGFVVRVDWFKPGAVKVGNTTCYESTTSKNRVPCVQLTISQSALQTDSYPTGQGRCFEKGSYLVDALISIPGWSGDHVTFGNQWDGNDQEIWKFVMSPGADDGRWLDLWGSFLKVYSGPGGEAPYMDK